MSKKGQTVIYILMSLLFLLISIKSAYNVTTIYKSDKLDVDTLSYESKLKVNHSVNIIENEFISKEVLPGGGTYITDLVDSMDFNLSYDYKTSEILDIKADYTIKATIVGYYNQNAVGADNPVIWEKEFILKDNQTITGSSMNFSIEEELNLDLDSYNEEAMKFKNTLEIPTVTMLKLEMPVKLTASNDKYELTDSKIITAEMKLTEKVFYVDAEQEKIEEQSFLPTKGKVQTTNSRGLVLHLSLLVSSLILIFLSIKRIPFVYHEFGYEDYIESLKFDYDDIIVETENMIDIRKYSSIFISSFKEMLNLSQNLETPIILFERQKFSTFYIIDGKIAYLFFVKNERKALKEILEKE